MGIVVGALTKFAKSGAGTSLYKWASEDKPQKLLATTLPMIETAVVTTTRLATIERQKGLSRREKSVLKKQDAVPAVVGIGIGSCLNKKVFDLSANIGEKLDSSKVNDLSKVQGALKVMTPIFTSILLMRLLLPISASFVSSKLEDKKEEKKLDIKA